VFVEPETWNQLSPEEKRKLRLDRWEKSEGLELVSPRAEANYRERIHRLRMAYDLETPDRIVADLSMAAGEYALRRKGLNSGDILYNREKLLDPIVEFNDEFQPDIAVSAFAYPGKIMELILGHDRFCRSYTAALRARGTDRRVGLVGESIPALGLMA
jgi:hypothetical protein